MPAYLAYFPDTADPDELEVEGAGKIPLNRREEDWETVYQGELESGGAETTLTFSKSSFFAADPKLGVLTIRKTP